MSTPSLPWPATNVVATSASTSDTPRRFSDDMPFTPREKGLRSACEEPSCGNAIGADPHAAAYDQRGHQHDRRDEPVVFEQHHERALVVGDRARVIGRDAEEKRFEPSVARHRDAAVDRAGASGRERSGRGLTTVVART